MITRLLQLTGLKERYYYVITQLANKEYRNTLYSCKKGFDFKDFYTTMYDEGFYNFRITLIKELNKYEVEQYNKLPLGVMNENRWKAIKRDQQINSILED